MQGFQQFYGNISEYCIIGLLPSYMERQGSSLVYMVDYLVKKSNHSSSGFYLDEYEQLYTLLQQLEAKGQKTILIGVTFALLDFAAQYPMELQHTIVMETGGMKGRGIEPTRMEVQTLLRQQLGVFKVHSEYGMTELLSQAYSNGDGLFTPATTMQVLVRSEDDPLQVNTTGNGLLNIIDLANVYSCAFIATDDIGTVYHDGTFTVLGRADNSDTRGCSLLTVH